MKAAAMTASPPGHEPASEPPAPPESSTHRSVFLQEVVTVLAPQAGQCVVDCTVGAGGHSAALIERLKPDGRLIGLDVDPGALALARQRLEPLASAASVKLNLVLANFSHISEILKTLEAPPPHGILADLGVSSMQLDRPERGFSFRVNAPLDMRMDPALSRTAADILREAGEEELADILFQLGEEHRSRRIARAIVAQRERQPVRTTGQLEELVRHALRVRGHRRIHPATKTFQALRLAVNRELESLTALLDAAPELLAPGGVLAVISFHSLEDRLVKQRSKALTATGRFQQVAKLVRPGAEEARLNPRSRSAKLRALRKL
jgi:16S rRNA (cytosine1402-N4)-methyltransferase